MTSRLPINFRLIIFYISLIVFAISPIWSVEYFINQDGSPHLYNSYILLELIRGNSVFTSTYAINSVPLPNLTGYFILAGLLKLFSAATVTKLMVTLIFAAFVAAVGWLRKQTAGDADLTTSLLFGAVLAFNWMWFLGFYNFIIGVVGFIFTLGWYWNRRENLNIWQIIGLSFLLFFVFFCHLISFGMLAIGILISGVFVSNSNIKRTLSRSLIAFLPVLPFVISYAFLSRNEGGGLNPVWESLHNPFSLSDWILQLLGADPFLLISRKSLPFVAIESNLFAIFTPFLWLSAALFILVFATLNRLKKKFFSFQNLPFILIAISSILFWIFAPDDFGKSNGGFLRERILLCGLVCFVPLFDSQISPFLKRAAQICLIFVLIFQTAAVWDYAVWANKLGQQYLTAKPTVEKSDSLASIVLIEDGCRFKANPLVSINTLLGIENNTLILDNYEVGYYLFPVVAKNTNDRQFTYDFTASNAINLCNPPEIEEKFSRLNALLDTNHEKIKVLLVWNGDKRVRALLSKWYEDQPFFENGKVSLYHLR